MPKDAKIMTKFEFVDDTRLGEIISGKEWSPYQAKITGVDITLVDGTVKKFVFPNPIYQLIPVAMSYRETHPKMTTKFPIDNEYVRSGVARVIDSFIGEDETYIDIADKVIDTLLDMGVLEDESKTHVNKKELPCQENSQS